MNTIINKIYYISKTKSHTKKLMVYKIIVRSICIFPVNLVTFEQIFFRSRMVTSLATITHKLKDKKINRFSFVSEHFSTIWTKKSKHVCMSLTRKHPVKHVWVIHHKWLRNMSEVVPMNKYNMCGTNHKLAQFIVSKIRECLLFSLASKYNGRVMFRIMLKT